MNELEELREIVKGCDVWCTTEIRFKPVRLVERYHFRLKTGKLKRSFVVEKNKENKVFYLVGKMRKEILKYRKRQLEKGLI